MSYIKKIAAAVTLAFSVSAFVSCVDMGVQHNDEVGYLSAPVLDVDLVVQNMLETKASAPVVEAPATSDIRFVVKDKDGNVKYDGTGLWSESIVLPVGAYSVDASYGSNGFGAPYFAGTASGTIDPLDNEVPALTVSLANALVCFEIDSDFAVHFDAGTSKVELSSASSDSEVAYGQWHYVPAGVDIVATFTGKNSAGKDASFSHTLKAPSAKVAYNVVCKPSSTSWPSITMSAVGESDVWASRAYISAATFANISEVNKAEVVYEAIPSASSDWTSPVLAALESGSLVLKGLTAGTEYKVRARVGALTSNEVSFTPSVDGLTVSAAHTSTNNELDGTDVTTSFSKSDRVKSAISSWTINICNSNGDILRTASSLGTSDGSALTGTTDWPYLPVGDYTVNMSATMNDGEVVSSEIQFTTADPAFVVTPTCKTTYDYYLAGDKANANAETGSKTAAATLPSLSLFEIGSSVGISSNLMMNTNYSKTVYYAAKKDQTVIFDATVDFGTSKSNTVGDIHNQFTDWRAYELYAEVTFAGTKISNTRSFHITGLPYNVSFYNNYNPSGWNFGSKNDGGNRVILKEGGAYALSPTFHIPSNTDVQVKLNAYAYGGSIPGNYKPTINFNASNTSTNAGNVEATLQGSNLLPTGGATYVDLYGDLTLLQSAERVCIYVNGDKYWSSVGGVAIGVVCDNFSTIYRL